MGNSADDTNSGKSSTDALRKELEGGGWGGGDRGEAEAGRDFVDRPDEEVAKQKDGDAVRHKRLNP